MASKKVIAICQSEGEFVTNKDGSLSCNGGEAYAIDIDQQTQLFKFYSHDNTFEVCGESVDVFSHDNKFEVRGESIDVVDIDHWDCSCRRWQLTGLRCCHAIAVFEALLPCYCCQQRR
ncbi:SWIM domain-containing protein [Cephalotus follicularis]|uniref:SWIM domain-containing protein n=1 Tax=Cephalotus follicularis TaxID=3775 RepID=A0A1Q3CE60_CEPFO|nr:SWIM domain-containing protein [Cephalotus follicularis]